MAERTEAPTLESRLRERLSYRLLPGAEVEVHDGRTLGEDHTGWATIEWRSIRLRMAYRAQGGAVSPVEPQAIEATAFLWELRDAGVSLSRTGSFLATDGGATLECAYVEHVDPPGARCRAGVEAPESVPSATLAPPDWMLPPSRRPRAGRGTTRPAPRAAEPAPVDAPAIAEVFARYPMFEVRGTPIDASTRLLLVMASDLVDGPTGELLCVVSREEGAAPLDCTQVDLDVIEGVVDAVPDGWRLVAERTSDVSMEDRRLLVSLLRGEGGLIVDTLDLGGMELYDEACVDRVGICVDVQCVAHDARFVAPDCIEVRPGGLWHATHVRERDRWIHERIDEAPGCAERYLLERGRFTSAACGPVATLPACARD